MGCASCMGPPGWLPCAGFGMQHACAPVWRIPAQQLCGAPECLCGLASCGHGCSPSHTPHTALAFSLQTTAAACVTSKLNVKAPAFSPMIKPTIPVLSNTTSTNTDDVAPFDEDDSATPLPLLSNTVAPSDEADSATPMLDNDVACDGALLELICDEGKQLAQLKVGEGGSAGA